MENKTNEGVVIKGVTACNTPDCESYQHELNYMGGNEWLCDEHLNEWKLSNRVAFEGMAMKAMQELGLPEDEAENMLEDLS